MYIYTCICVYASCLCFCYVYFAHNGLPQLASIVCLLGCGLVSCDTTLVTEFLDIYHGQQVVCADSWILQSRCCSINTLVAGVLPAMDEKMFALEVDLHAAQVFLPLVVVKCFTTVVFNWLIHTVVEPNLHRDSAMLEEGGIVLFWSV